MKLIYINTVDCEEISGQGSFERNFLSFLKENRDSLNLKIFTINPKENIVEGKTISLRLNKDSKISYCLYQIKSFFYLLKEVLRNRNRICFYVRLSPFNLSPFIIAKIFRLKIIVRSGPVLQNLSSYGKVKNEKLLKIFRKILYFYYHTSKEIIVVTDKIKERIISDFKLNASVVHVIKNPINEKQLNCHFDKGKIKREYQIKPPVKIIGFVGDVYKDQGVQDILAALSIIRNKLSIDNIRVLVVGSGTYLSECQRIVGELHLENHVIFSGRVEPFKVVEYINSFDVCVAPFTKADYDTKGSSALKILEYLYCNKPVVTIDVLEYQFIEEHNFGVLYELGNVYDLSRKIILALSRDHAIESKNYVMKHYSNNNIFRKYLKIIMGGDYVESI